MNKGFTLFESLISMLIMGLIVAGILGILTIGMKTWDNDMGLLDLQQQTRAAVSGMVSELRQGTLTCPPPDGSTADFTVPTDITPTPSENIEYRLSNNQIIRDHPAGNRKVIANNINSLNFSLNGKILLIQVGAFKIVKGRQLLFNVTEQVWLRN